MSEADSKIVEPCSKVRGSVRVPGDKSISHRLAMLTALASGESVIRGFLTSEDCLNTLGAMEALGASVSCEGTTISVKGISGRLSMPAGVLDMENSGTGMRLLAGLLSGQEFTTEMTGDESLRSRPMRRIKEPLELMGAKVELLGERGCAPMRITGGRLRGIEYRLPVASAQVKSCVLLAGLYADGETKVVEPKPSRDHTELALRAMGVELVIDGASISLEGSGTGSPGLEGREWVVPGDFSSAAFWIAAAACREGSEAVVENIGLNPRRTAFLNVLRRMGGESEVKGQRSEVRGVVSTADQAEWETVGTVCVKGTKLRGTEIGGEQIPSLIDELPLVAVVGALADGETVIRDAAELRVKESDRIAAIARGLAAMGVEVEEKPDGMVVKGAGTIRGGVEVDSADDHRVAMALAVLALFADAPVKIKGVSCISTSYPGFWEDLQVMVDG